MEGLDGELARMRDELFNYLNEKTVDEGGVNGMNLTSRLRSVLDKVACAEFTPTTMKLIGEISIFMGNLFLKGSNNNSN